MKKNQQREVAAASAPMNVSLTLDERDAIDAAKGRIRRFSALITSYSYFIEPPGVQTDEDAQEAIGELTELIYEAAVTIDEAFEAADARKERGAR